MHYISNTNNGSNSVAMLSIPNIYKEVINKSINFILSCKISNLNSIILFGSAARGELKLGSDIDILIISDTEISRDVRSEIQSVLNIGCNGISVDVVFYLTETFNTSESLLVNRVRKDGKVVWRTS